MKKILITAFIVSILATGCMKRVSVTRMGIYPAKPADCDIEVQNVDMQTATQTHKHIGMVSVSGYASDIEINEALMAEVKTEACKMGGDMISLNAQSGSGSGVASAGITQFLVWVTQ